MLQAKRDKQKQTGASGGKGAIMTQVDDLVLEIIGKNSAAICGVTSKEMWDEVVEPLATTSTDQMPPTQPTIEAENVVPTGTRKRKRRSDREDLEMEFYYLRNENLRLKNQLLRLKIAKEQTNNFSFLQDLNQNLPE